MITTPLKQSSKYKDLSTCIVGENLVLYSKMNLFLPLNLKSHMFLFLILKTLTKNLAPVGFSEAHQSRVNTQWIFFPIIRVFLIVEAISKLKVIKKTRNLHWFGSLSLHPPPKSPWDFLFTFAFHKGFYTFNFLKVKNEPFTP